MAVPAIGERSFLHTAYEAFAEAATTALDCTQLIDRRFVMGEITIRIRAAGPALPDLLFPALEHASDSSARVKADLTLDLFDTSTTGAHPPRFPWTAREVGPRGEIAGGGQDVRAVFHGDLLAPRHDFRAVSLFSRRRAHGVLWVLSPARVPWWERAAPLRTLLHLGLGSPPDRMLVHGAAVAMGTAGGLLIGAGGSGKSTTAVACVHAGMKMAGDDYVLLDAPSRVAYPLYSTAKLTPDSLALLPDTAFTLRARDGFDAQKRVINLGADRRSCPVSPVAIDSLIMPRIVSTNQTRIYPASAAAALRALAPTTMLQLPGDNRSMLSPLADLARTLPAYILEIGGSPLEAARALGVLLQGQPAA